MRKIRIFEHISLDGVIQNSGGPGEDDFPFGDWTAAYRSPAGLRMMVAAYGERFDLFLAVVPMMSGRVSVQGAAGPLQNQS